MLGRWSNVRGWRTERPLIVFESDDWGAIRMRDPATLEAMASQGLDFTKSRYDRLDCLENGGDLQSLFNVLDAYRDEHGRPPIFTFNTVMGNPDFPAIKADGFERFKHEPLFQSYQRYYGEDLQPVWNQAMQESLIRPQFHAREHLNVGLWLRDLQAGRRETLLAFDHEFFSLTTRTSSPRQRNYLAAYWPESASHFEEIRDIVIDGLGLFEQLFGYASRSFIACNYVLPKELESTLAARGIDLIQGQRGQLRPSMDGRNVSIRRSYTGQRNRLGQYYSVRNVSFEPFEDQSRDLVAAALSQIKQAFYWGKPAIVSTHRVNYVGGMDMEHRDNNLRLLDQLLGKILAMWPDVEFTSSDELAAMMVD